MCNMKNIMLKNKLQETMLDRLVEMEVGLKKLPPLTPVQKAKLDNARAIDHLYYSSKIEGSSLTDKRLEKAIHGEI